MQISLITFSIALAGLVSAQTQGANNCVTSLLPSSCNLNPSCICADQNFITNISCCIFNACPTSDQQAALDYAKMYCTPVGVSLPASAGCSSGASASATSSASISGSSAVLSGIPSSASTASSVSATTTGSASSTASSTAASATSAAASSATSHAAAGEKLAAHGLGLVGALVGAVALL